MEPQSPPKRVTRSRAAKATDIAPTKPVTSSARAKSATSTSTTSSAAATTRKTTAAKRKLRSEDTDHTMADDYGDELGGFDPSHQTRPIRSTRGRPPKASGVEAAKNLKVETSTTEVASEATPEAAVVRRPRGRPPKKVATPVATEETAEAPVKRIRNTRTKNTITDSKPEESEVSRSASSKSKPNTTTKAQIRKTVKFEEPEKENILPATSTKPRSTKSSSAAKPAVPEPAASGLRAGPIRKPSLPAAARSLRGTARAEETNGDVEAPKKLNSKKITRLSRPRNLEQALESDDELAVDKVPQRPLVKAPIRPNSGVRAKSKTEASLPERTEDGPEQLQPPELQISTGLLGSPARRVQSSSCKDTISSPARKGMGLPILGLPKDELPDQSTQSRLKSSLLCSPAKRIKSPVKNMPPSNFATIGDNSRSTMKTSLLSSPAKRPISPTKILRPPRPMLDQHIHDAIGNEDEVPADVAACLPTSPRRTLFPGRLSTVLPRHADPDLQLGQCGAENDSVGERHPDTDNEDYSCDLMDVDGDEPSVDIAHGEDSVATEERAMNGAFGLRDRELDPYTGADSGSDDEIDIPAALNSHRLEKSPLTPCRTSGSRAATERLNTAGPPSSIQTTKRDQTSSQYGFTPLADKLSAWKSNSPLKTGLQPDMMLPESLELQSEAPVTIVDTALQNPEANPTFFDEAMSVAPAAALVIEHQSSEATVEVDMDIGEPEIDDIACTREDMELAAEADEMSLLGAAQIDEVLHGDALDDSTSETSQEYGDENDAPIDPALRNSPGIPPVTPQRPVIRSAHTVSKIPLKPADESTPKSVGFASQRKQRRYSLGKLPTAVSPNNRPTNGLRRNATVISYSPKKASIACSSPKASRATTEAPSRSDASRSIAGTPARTPQKDMNRTLLRGAIVFVDVRTSQGAEANTIFVDLLTQMGAQCVESWDWSPGSNFDGNASGDGSLSDSKVGITHVVFKDGEKSTLEKVQQSRGVVQCVGVSWVLDCERENQWLEEAPYYIETSRKKQGGARRRQSVDPMTFAESASSSLGGEGDDAAAHRECMTAPATPANDRRRSSLWMRTPENEESATSRRASAIYGDDDTAYEDNENGDWELESMLMPVPKTPAPEAIARYAANVTPGTPSVDDTILLGREELTMRTCPPKPAGLLLGDGLIAREKDEGVLQRLMAARRKSLQFAPKIGSPLAKTWP